MDKKDINKAHKTWCYVAAKFLWIIKGESADLPDNRTRRGEVMPLKEIEVANKINASTRSARNLFSNHVERILGLATDLKGGISRFNKGIEEEEFTIEYGPTE